MKRFLFFFAFVCSVSAQQHRFRVFDYAALPARPDVECSQDQEAQLRLAEQRIASNRSEEGLRLARSVFDGGARCLTSYSVYANALFRNGQWDEGAALIDQGIDTYGSDAQLIKNRALFALEMAELGTGQRHIDGNAVYKPGAAENDSLFRLENYRVALHDLSYLSQTYGEVEDTYYKAKLQQRLGDLEGSNATLATLSAHPDMGTSVRYEMASNQLALGQTGKAEAETTALLAEHPREPMLYDLLARIREVRGDEAGREEARRRKLYYSNLPDRSEMAYSEANYEMLRTFAEEGRSTEEKLRLLDELLKKGDAGRTVDVCLMVLRLHANHGNGVEEKAAAILSKIGKPAIGKVNALFGENISTCTVTYLAEVMAEVKDPASWELLVAYLDYIPDMPMTLMTPAIPEMLVRFDRKKGLAEVLRVVRPMLTRQEEENALPSFGDYVFYVPIKEHRKEALKMAAGMGYSKDELTALRDRID